MSSKIHIGKKAQALSVSPKFEEYSKVVVVIDEHTAVEAGDDSGRTLEIECPWGTQELASDMLQRLSGFKYQPYNARKADLDPAAEVGDGVTLNGIYSGIFNTKTTFGRKMASDLTANKDEEIDHEFPFKGQDDRKFVRKLKEIDSEFSMQASAIAAKVSQVGGSSSFEWNLTANNWAVKADGVDVFKVSRTGAKVVGEIVATSGSIGGCTITDGLLHIENANIDNLNASKITAGILDYDRLEDNSMPGSKIADGGIGSTKYGTGSVGNGALGWGSVSYGKTTFTGTLDQVGINTSNIEAMRSMFVSSMEVQNLVVSGLFYMRTSGGVLRRLVLDRPTNLAYALGLGS